MNTKTNLSNAFGDYRSEWRPDLFGTLFIRPPYFDELEAPRPCLLVGGRGTGKTTALKSLRFDATALRSAASAQLPYLGVYLRINKNRASAFYGDSLNQLEWDRLFAHYFNLHVSLEFTRLLLWLASNEGQTPLTVEELNRLSSISMVQAAETLDSLASNIKRAIDELEIYVNNSRTQPRPLVSMAEAPLRAFVELIQARDKTPRPIFCCIDEYENLSDRQQEVINTYVKHSEFPLCFKLGVRRFGLRSRRTSNEDDSLATPDDYSEIDIANSAFDEFATDVANLRLKHVAAACPAVPAEIRLLLPSLTRKDEAALLGAKRIADKVVAELDESGNNALSERARAVGVDAYFIRFWQESKQSSLLEAAADVLDSTVEFDSRMNNYGYASLFWITKGHKGTLIRKYYCGLETFLGLSSGNIRYFLELVHESIKRHDFVEGAASFVVEPRDQTMAARDVGKRRLDQLEGFSIHSIAIKRLVLALGRVFFELARSPEGHTPEVSSFVLSGSEKDKEEVTALLMEGVSNLAFEASPRTKATSVAEMKDEEYRLHPIFCPYFEFSHRRKRRTTFDAAVLLGVSTNPREAIRALLADRTITADDDLPQQLDIFSSFFSGGQ